MPQRQEGGPLKVTSPAFSEGQTIPAKYTCDGGDLIPPLAFEGVPPKAVTIALVMDDPDAPGGTWDHWVIWNMPPSQHGIAEGKAPQGTVGRNSWKKNSWGGPCPPDREHRYFFKVYALDRQLDIPPNSGREQLERAMEGHIIEQAQLMGRYDRKR